MYKVGESVVYGQNGVMTVLDIRTEEVLGNQRKYYVLHSPGTGEDSLTFVPCDSEKLTAQMRPLMSKKDVETLLKDVKDSPMLEWTDDARARSNLFKKIIDSGDYKDLIRMIFAIEERLSERADTGKRSYISDEITMKKAKRLVYSEISAVLGLGDGETEEFVRSSAV